MDLATSVILILAFIVIYVILVQIYSVLFRITGLTKEKALFQSVSLLTNSGFTTSESEVITSDRLRRRIATAAMISGYAFSVVIVSLIINVLISLKGDYQDTTLMYVVYGFSGFIIIIIITQIPIVKRNFEKLIQSIATRLLKRSNNENVIIMLDNYGRDAMAEVYLNRVPDFMVDKTVLEMKINSKYRINILMFKRNGKAMDVTVDTVFKKRDHLVVFGSAAGIKNAFMKRKGETKHNVIELIEEYGEEAMTEITLNQMPEFLNNKGLFESGLKSNYYINLLTIKRKDQFIPVTKDVILQVKDVIVVFGPYDKIKEAFMIREKEDE